VFGLPGQPSRVRDEFLGKVERHASLLISSPTG
jgi:hypothetical protein